jgi:hypothetical protein
VRVLLAALLVLTVARSAAAAPEPWSDQDPPAPPSRLVLTPGSDIGFRGAAEYRVNAVSVTPVDLASTTDKDYQVIDQRLRLDGAVDYRDLVRITTSIDALSGVLWGDNGTRGTDPEPTSGSAVATTNPNVSTSCITLKPGATPTDATSYHYGLCSGDPVFVRRLYGDVMTPVGLLRIGRQPFTEGASIAVNDGDGRRNRFGVAGVGNSADRILFATKPLEAFVPPAQRDKSLDRGLFLILAYDRLVTGDPMDFGSDLHDWITAVRWLVPRFRGGGDFEMRAYHAYRWSDQYDTAVSAFGTRVMARFGEVSAGLEASTIVGSTSEISEAYHVINDDPVVPQQIRQAGARGVVRWDRKLFSLYLETDYASGDSDPSVGAPLTQYKFAPDTNVGLLMFKQVLAYQSARDAAAGVALLQQLGAKTFPIESVDTQGSFTNAVGIFPQFDLHPLPDLLLRGGMLVAYAPAKVVDPIASLQRRGNVPSSEVLVNYAGGSADNRYYGTELDGRIQYKMFRHFEADLEGAVLFPGGALADVNGDAVRSFLVQARATFFM